MRISTSNRQKRRHAKGFTLIEVLVSLAIIAIALTAGVQAIGALLNNAQRQNSALLAQLCADNALVKLRLSRQMPPVGVTEFTCPQAGVVLGGTLSVFVTPNPDFHRVEAKVRDDAGASAYPILTVVTIVGRF